MSRRYVKSPVPFDHPLSIRARKSGVKGGDWDYQRLCEFGTRRDRAEVYRPGGHGCERGRTSAVEPVGGSRAKQGRY